MNRFKLVCIGLAMLIAAMVMCSCVNEAKAETQSNGYSVTVIGELGYGMRLYRVHTPKGSYDVLFNYKGGLCILK